MSNTNIQSALSQKRKEPFPPEPAKTCAVSYWGSQRVYSALVETEALGGCFDSPLPILACDAKGCSDKAVFFRVCFHPCKLGKIWIYRRKKGRTLCPAHARKAAQRAGLEVIRLAEQVTEHHQRVIAFEAEMVAWEVKVKEVTCRQESHRLADLKAAEMAAQGKVLLATGYEGRLYQLPDGRQICFLKDGTQQAACCWLEAQRVIDARHRGHRVTGHSQDCLFCEGG